MAKRLSIILLYILFSFLALTAYGQDYPVRHFSVEDGLPSNTIYNIYRDAKGFLWISTDKGVVRYNGIKFEKFTTADGLADNEVFFSKEDKEGRIWFGSYNGELCFYKNDSFHNARNTPYLNTPQKYPFIERVLVDKDSTVTFVYGRYYIYCIKGDKGYEVDLRNIDVAKTSTIVLVQRIDKNILRLVYSEFILDLDISWSKPRVLRKLPSPLFVLGCEKRIGFFLNQNQEYLVNECSAFDTRLKTIRAFPPEFTKKNYIYTLYYDGSNFFTATNHGLYINDSIRIFEHDKISGITQDYNKDYWVATLDNGIFSLSKSFLSSGISYDAYQGKVVYVKELEGRLFFTTEDENLSVFDNDVSRVILNGAKYTKTGLQYESSTFLIDSNARYYHIANNRSVVVDNVLDDHLNIKQYYNNSLPTFHSLKKAINVGDEIFINGTHNYLNVNYNNYASGSTVRYRFIDDSSKSERIFGSSKGPDNSIWYSTVSKMYKVLDGKPVEQPQFKSALKNFDFFGSFLVGYTHNNELLICENYNSNNIQIDTIVQNCVWDKFYKVDENNILISTSELHYMLTFNKLGTLPKYSVLPIENPFVPLRPEAICVGANYCYFFKGGNIIKMDKKNLVEKLQPPTVHFKTLNSVNKQYRIGRFMEIPFEDSRNMTISLSTISFGNMDVTYQYSISKNDQDNWTPLVGELNLINPGYGLYTVKVRAKTASSDFSKPATFTLHILRPYWATWWFIYLMVCSVIFIIWASVQRRVHVTLAKKEKEHQNHVRFIKSEYKAMNALMNPHFIFNTLNNVQSLVNSNDKLGANEYLRVFADLIRLNMSNVSREMIPLQEEVNLVSNYLLLEKLRFEDRLSYSINVAGGIDLSDIMVPPLLLQPLVENSIKHGILPMKGKHGIVNIYIYERSEVLYIDVKDNGIGIEKAKENKSLHESFGLNNIQTRIEQLSIIQGKKLSFNIGGTKDDGGTLQWTVATITMPIS